MTQKDNILQELNELGSQLAGHQPSTTYAVPAGYFEGLIEQVMRRIRALEAVAAAEELEHLSPVLSKLSKQMPYEVPAGYFDNIAERMVLATKDDLAASEETASISPLLGSLKKEMPYSVPAGYFENLAGNIAAKESATQAKVISITRSSWFRYAAAAVVTGIVFLAGFLVFNKADEQQAGSKVFTKVSKDVKKLNDTQKDDLLDFLDAGMNGTETAQVNTDNKSKEIKQLLQDIPEEELKDFQEQTEDLGLGEISMTN